MGVESLVIKRIFQNGPEYKALLKASSEELVACHLYTQKEVDAMHTPRGFMASWLPWGHYIVVDSYGADVDGRVIGCIQLLQRDDSTAIFEFLYVDKDFREKHVATALIHEALTQAMERNPQAVEVYTMEGEPKAVRFWTKFFTPMSPNVPGHVMLVGKRLEAIGWRLPPDRFPGQPLPKK